MSFDLNIKNYTKGELIEMFGLPNTYDITTLQMNETKLRDNILTNTKINKDTQIKTLNFLVQAKNILLNGLTDNNNNNNNSAKSEKFQDDLNKIYHLSHKLVPSVLNEKSEHMVQQHPINPFVSSSPGEFFQGVINPLKKGYIKKNLNIDTRFRENYYTTLSTNFNFNLPLVFNNVMSIQLNSIELPTSFYNVSKQYNNNYFTVVVDGVSKVLSIADGSYSVNGIVLAINTALTNLGGVFADVVFSASVNNILTTNNQTGGNSGSGQMLVGLTLGSSVTSLTLNFQADRIGLDDRNTPLPLKLGWILGFRNGIYTNNLNYVSEGVIDTAGPKYLFLVIDDHNNNVNNGFYSAFNSSMLNNNILARISVMGTGPFTILTQNILNVTTLPREYFGPVNIQNMVIQLLDEYGRIIDLNNMDFSFCLTLATVYDV